MTLRVFEAAGRRCAYSRRLHAGLLFGVLAACRSGGQPIPSSSSGIGKTASSAAEGSSQAVATRRVVPIAVEQRRASPTDVAPRTDEAQIVRAVLLHAAVRPYLHEELPHRLPITLRPSNLVAPDFALRLLGSDVRVADGPKNLYLHLTFRSESEARVNIQYAAEGIRGSARAVHSGDRWSIAEVQLDEH